MWQDSNLAYAGVKVPCLVAWLHINRRADKHSGACPIVLRRYGVAFEKMDNDRFETNAFAFVDKR